jgi:hypothetical protein
VSLLRLGWLRWKEVLHLESPRSSSRPVFSDSSSVVVREVVANNGLILVRLARERRRLASLMRSGELPTREFDQTVEGLFSSVLGDDRPTDIHYQVALDGRKPLFVREVARATQDIHAMSAGKILLIPFLISFLITCARR